MKKYLFNEVTPEELWSLSKELRGLINYRDKTVTVDDELESRVRMTVNSLMDGDAGDMFLHSHSSAVSFIAYLLDRLACEIDELREEA